MPLSPDDLFAKLAALGMAVTTVKHPPLFTVEQSKSLRGELPGGHTKNLFLKDKKDCMWLVTAEEDRPIDLKALGTALGASGRVSFGSPERLMRHVGVIPGAVTPFGLANDIEGQVSFVTNEATTAIAREDFLRFMAAIGHAPRLLALPARAIA
jgi:Ala-tRNA(Pro) deacylase